MITCSTKTRIVVAGADAEQTNSLWATWNSLQFQMHHPQMPFQEFPLAKMKIHITMLTIKNNKTLTSGLIGLVPLKASAVINEHKLYKLVYCILSYCWSKPSLVARANFWSLTVKPAIDIVSSVQLPFAVEPSPYTKENESFRPLYVTDLIPSNRFRPA